MYQKLDLLESDKSVKRNIKSRTGNKNEFREKALKFEKEYFDGDRNTGYGGYYYDGRWVKIAKKIIDIFDLKQGSKFLDVGCAKGFLLYDLYNQINKIELYGIDVSKYAKENAPLEIKNNIITSNCKQLDFKDNYFDAVVSINTIHNLDLDDCKNALREIQRVSGGNAFIQVDAYRDEEELEIFKDWMLTAKTYLKPDEWLDLFDEIGYTGYYYWTILTKDGTVI